MKFAGYAIYVTKAASIGCTETGIEVPRMRPESGPFGGPSFVTVGDTSKLNDACPGHTHAYSVEAVMRVKYDAEWTEADEAGAVTVYPPEARP